MFRSRRFTSLDDFEGESDTNEDLINLEYNFINDGTTSENIVGMKRTRRILVEHTKKIKNGKKKRDMKEIRITIVNEEDNSDSEDQMNGSGVRRNRGMSC